MRHRIGFVQQVFGTEWAARSRACIQRQFPDAPVLQVEGLPPRYWRNWLKPALQSFRLRGRSTVPEAVATPAIGGSSERTFNPAWMLRQHLSRKFAFDPLKPILHARRLNVDYLVTVDEDCFLQDGSQLLRLLDEMDGCGETLLAGPSDGGTPFREVRNPLACNLFFNVIKWNQVRKLMKERPDWRQLRITDVPNSLVVPPLRETPERPMVCGDPFNFDDYEPYYPLYWLILSAGYRIKYLPVSLTNDERRASEIRLDASGDPLCFHLWYMREWVAKREIDVYGMPNSRRYEAAYDYLESRGLAATGVG